MRLWLLKSPIYLAWHRNKNCLAATTKQEQSLSIHSCHHLRKANLYANCLLRIDCSSVNITCVGTICCWWRKSLRSRPFPWVGKTCSNRYICQRCWKDFSSLIAVKRQVFRRGISISNFCPNRKESFLYTIKLTLISMKTSLNIDCLRGKKFISSSTLTLLMESSFWTKLHHLKQPRWDMIMWWPLWRKFWEGSSAIMW